MKVRARIAGAALRLGRWRLVGEPPRRGIVIGAPHTSNWDFVFGLLVLWRLCGTMRPRILVKSELFRGPLGWLLRRLDAIEVDRRNPGGLVRGLVRQLEQDPDLVIVLATEGTRSGSAYWKSGFYRIARDTGLPVHLGFVDGPTRTVGFGPSIELTGDVGADMDRVRAFYADKHGVKGVDRPAPRLREEDGPDGQRRKAPPND